MRSRSLAFRTDEEQIRPFSPRELGQEQAVYGTRTGPDRHAMPGQSEGGRYSTMVDLRDGEHSAAEGRNGSPPARNAALPPEDPALAVQAASLPADHPDKQQPPRQTARRKPPAAETARETTEAAIETENRSARDSAGDDSAGWSRLTESLSRQSLNRMLQELSRVVYGSGLYRLTLVGGTPNGLLPMLPDAWPGDPEQGRRILSGCFCFAGETVERASNLWRPRNASQGWLDRMHSFDWMRDLRCTEQPEAARLGRALVAAWIDAHPNWTPTAWAPDVLGTRLTSWITHADFLLGDDEAFRSVFFGSLARQARHLNRCLPAGLQGIRLLRAIRGLLWSGLAMPDGDDRSQRALKLLGQAIESQVLPDGGHVERNPSVQLEFLQHLLDIRALLNARQIELPDYLQPALDRMTPMLRFFCHGDGGLALFNGGREEGYDRLALTLKRADMRGRPPIQAPHSGFHRLQLGRSLLIMDTGNPPAKGLDDSTHAGTLSFEFSVGKERLIVNCGSMAGGSDVWQAAQKSTAAHSTLTVADTNSSEILPEGGIGRRPGMVVCHRDQGDGKIWLEARHDGYRRTHGLVHRRRLYFAKDGDDLRGEDWLVGQPGADYALRFHLHPLVRASVIRDGEAALLRLPSGGGWRLRVGGGGISLAESVYLGDGTLRRTQQLVISGQMEDKETRIRWALQREG